ncbi:MAG: integration host factor subunit alpha [Desulfobacterales bacterium]|nr:integration host factor subunit alpha [Desulfobacterales bacterium]MBF0395901.1 integration host factor subunit alpha [Desulfobacterales bacterium]
MDTLTKADIVTEIQNKMGYSKEKCVDVVEKLMEIIKKTLETGEDVLISGFGKFCVKDKKERRGRNPATGEDMILPKRRVITFKCSGILRNKVNH